MKVRGSCNYERVPAGARRVSVSGVVVNEVSESLRKRRPAVTGLLKCKEIEKRHQKTSEGVQLWALGENNRVCLLS